jgi:hypothetical protein
MRTPQAVTLEGHGVRLEPLAREHHDGLVAAASDGELWKLWNGIWSCGWHGTGEARMLYRGTCEGGCFCCAIRYAFLDVFDAGYCHCSICRRTSGAPVIAWVNTPRASFRVLLVRRASSRPRRTSSVRSARTAER